MTDDAIVERSGVPAADPGHGVRIEAAPFGPWQTNAYLVWDGVTPDALVLDPGMGAAEPLMQRVAAHRLRLHLIANSHGHIDHMWSAQKVADTYGCPVFVHPEDRAEVAAAQQRTVTHKVHMDLVHRIVRPDGEVRWCAGTAAASSDKNGRVVRVSGVTVDITERKQAEARQNLLAREVDHRAKNALALAQSIVRLTRGENVKTYIRSVEGRINALARVHTVLSLSSWQGAEIGKLVDEELAPYSTGEQITLSGPEVQLEPATAQTVALALHELVTNSAKYGALSTLSGRLSVSWEDQAHLLRITWAETGGPPVAKPTSRGFGTRSVIASIESQLGGQAEFDWRPQGLVCCLSVPLSPSQPTPDDVSLREAAADADGLERAGR